MVPRKNRVPNFLSFGHAARKAAGEHVPEGTMLSPDKEKFLDRCWVQAGAMDIAGDHAIGEGAGASIREDLLEYYGEVRATPEGLASQTSKIAVMLPRIDSISVPIAERGQYVTLYKGFVINPVQLSMAKRYLADKDKDPLALHCLSYALLHWYKLPDGSMSRAGLPSTTTEALIGETYEDTFRMKNEYQKRLCFRIKALGADHENQDNLAARGAGHELHLSGSENEIVLASKNTYSIVEITEEENRVIFDYVATGESDIGNRAIAHLHGMHGFPDEVALHQQNLPVDILDGAPVVNLDAIPEDEALKSRLRHQFRRAVGPIMPRHTQELAQERQLREHPLPAGSSSSKSPTPVKTFWVPPRPEKWTGVSPTPELDAIATPANLRRTRQPLRPSSVVPPTYVPPTMPSHDAIFFDPMMPLLKNIDYRRFLSASDVSTALSNLIGNPQAHRYHAQHLMAGSEHATDFIRTLRRITAKVTNISSLGLQSTLRKSVIDDPEFQGLMRERENVALLVSISVIANLPPQVRAFLLDNSDLLPEIDAPLFHDRNAFTQMSFTGRFDGMEVQRGHQVFPKLWRNNLLTDLLLNCPVHSLQTNANGYEENVFLDAERVSETIACYEDMNRHLKDILRVEPSNALENRFICEDYDPRHWDWYIDRMFKLGDICAFASYELQDNCGDRLEDLLSRSVESIIADRLLLTEKFSHFLLDPKHLANVLGFNYGKVLPRWRDLVFTIAGEPELDEDRELAAKQIFHRMKLLEFELFKEIHVNDNPEFRSPKLRDDLMEAAGLAPVPSGPPVEHIAALGTGLLLPPHAPMPMNPPLTMESHGLGSFRGPSVTDRNMRAWQAGSAFSAAGLASRAAPQPAQTPLYAPDWLAQAQSTASGGDAMQRSHSATEGSSVMQRHSTDTFFVRPAEKRKWSGGEDMPPYHHNRYMR